MCAWLIHLKGLPFIGAVQKCRNRVRDHIRDKRRKSGMFFLPSSIAKSQVWGRIMAFFFFFFKSHLETTCQPGVACSYDSYFPFLSRCLLRRKEDSAFHAAGAASIRMPPLKQPHGGGCQWRAKQIRSRNDAPVFPHYFRSNGAITDSVCVYTRAPSRSCST